MEEPRRSPTMAFGHAALLAADPVALRPLFIWTAGHLTIDELAHCSDATATETLAGFGATISSFRAARTEFVLPEK